MTLSTDTQDSALQNHLVGVFDLAFGMVCELAERFDDQTARTAPDGHLPLNWYLGHLACSKDYVSMLYQGGECALTPEFYQLYADDCAEVDFAAAESLDEMFTIYRQTHGKLGSLVASLTTGDLERETEQEILAPLAEDWKVRLAKLGSAISLIQMHDAFHCGQLQKLCIALGMDVPF